MRNNSLSRETLIGVVAVFGLMLYGVLRYPASLNQGGSFSFLTTAGALLAYGGLAVWAGRQSSAGLQTALRQGAFIGVLLGAAAVANLVLELFANLDASWSAVVGVSQWGLVFLAFGAAGSAAYLKLGSLPLAILAAIWSALVSTVITLLCGYGIGLAAMPHMQQILQGAYAQSGMTNPQAFVIQNTLASGSLHVLLAPMIALAFGFAGALAAALLRSVRGSAAIGLAVLELLLAAGGLASLRIASSLERSLRPPYVMFGLLALGVTMACLHPILTAIRRPPPSTS